jgi:aspartate ammonia-lyase
MSKPQTSKNERIETDSLGEVKINKDALFGSYTQRVINNYQISGKQVPEEFLKNYIGIKRIYAHINYRSKKIQRDKVEAIIEACDDLLNSVGTDFMQNFPIDCYQSGGGTSTNMAINEVIANLAEEKLGGKRGSYKMIHPNDDVNMSQSSNDTFPGVMKITFYYQLDRLIDVMYALNQSLEVKAKEFKSYKKVGRTHLQDALEINLGSEFGAFARTIEKDMKNIAIAQKWMTELPFGATALGSKQNITSQMRKDLIEEISNELDIKFSGAKDYYEATSSSSDFSKLSSTLTNLSNDIIKISNDLRLLASGPRAGIGEIRLPEVQPGSSIMPGKVNPSIPEVLSMVAFDVIGNDTTVQIATRSAQLQLQQFMPIIAWNLYESIDLLTQSLFIFNRNCILGIMPNESNIEKNLTKTFVYATRYAEQLGYDKVAELYKEANKKGLDLKGLLEEELAKKDS